MSTLAITLTPLAHPFPDAPGSSLELWGRLQLAAEPQGEDLVNVQWDLAEFADWFARVRTALLSEDLTGPAGELLVADGQSLADALDHAQQHPPVGDDESEQRWYTRLYDYRTRHVLTFALRGSRVPPVVIGRNGDDGEASLADPDGWSYRFDLTRFVALTRTTVLDMLETWHPTDARADDHRHAIIALL